MKKNVIIIVTLFYIVAGCNKPEGCRLLHYTNPTPRPVRNFISDTLTMSQLAEIYNDLIDGDTLAVQGCISSRDSLRGGGIFPTHYKLSMYMYDAAGFDTVHAGYGSRQFLNDHELWLDPLSEMWEIPTETQVFVMGVLHFDFSGEKEIGTPGICHEYSCLEVLDYSIGKEE